MGRSRADLSYSVRVQDRDLKRLIPILRQVKRELASTNTASAATATRSTTAWARTGRATRGAEKDFGRAARGAIAASGAMRSLGKSIAFTSGAFLGAAGIVGFIRQIITASSEEENSLARLRAQFKANGLSLRSWRKELNATIQTQSILAAVDDELVQDSFVKLLRATKDVTTAEKLNALALNISAGEHMDLLTAAKLVAKVYAGNVGALTRYGIVLQKGTTPLQALIELERRYRGQAEASAKTTAGAGRQFKVAFENIEEGIGRGTLAAIGTEFRRLAGDLRDPKAMERMNELGESIGRKVGKAIVDVTEFVKRNWPTIVALFNDAKIAARFLADQLRRVKNILDGIAGITPGGSGTLIRLIVSAYLAGKLLKLINLTRRLRNEMLLLGAAEGGAGALSLGGLGIGALLKGRNLARVLTLSVAMRGGRLASLVEKIVMTGSKLKIGTGLLAIDLIFNKKDRDQLIDNILGRKGSEVDKLTSWVNDKLHIPEGGLLGQFLPSWAGGPSDDKKAKPTWHAEDIRNAQRAGQQLANRLNRILGGGSPLDQDLSKLKIPPTSAQLQAAAARAKKLAATLRKALAGAANVFDERFGRVVDKALRAFDARTTALEERLRATVRVGNVRFTISADGKTPAERELDAMDKVEQKRHAREHLFDAQEDLATARQIGDPRMIRKAQRDVQDAEDEVRRPALEKRAELERRAADKALEQARKEFEARRDLLREHLQDELEALRKRIDAGKTSAEKGRRQLLAILGRYGVDLKGAGDDLGKAFAKGLNESLDSVYRSIGKVRRAYLKLAETMRKAKLGNALAGAAAVGAAAGAAKPKGHAGGGVVGGSGSGDSVPAMLEPNEVVLSRRDVSTLARMLGTRGPRGVLAAIRQRRGMAAGGVVGEGGIDDELLKRLLKVVARGSLRDARARARGVPTVPMHIQHLVQHGSKARFLPFAKQQELMSKLSQAQAHPFGRAGLLRATPTGTQLGPAGGGASHVTINVNGARDPRATARAVRTEFVKISARNPTQTRGRGKRRTALGDRTA